MGNGANQLLAIDNMFRTEISQYKVIEYLGGGGNSQVYLVLQSTGEYQGLFFAMKLFTNIEKKDRVERFSIESKILRELNHPSIMRVIDNGVYVDNRSNGHKNYPFVIAEYLPRTLRSALSSSLTMAEKVSYAMQLISALGYMQQRTPQLLHRDIKPENIFIKGRSCVLGDFGLLKEVGGNAEEGFDIQESAGIRFPRDYPSPDLVEYCKGRISEAELSTKSDVFQLGIVFSEIFCSEHPLKVRGGPYEKIEINSDALNVIVGSASRKFAIKSILTKMLEVDTARRPFALDLYDELEGLFLEVAKDSLALDGRVFA